MYLHYLLCFLALQFVFSTYSYKSILVDHSGYANFSTVQSAIDSVPSNNNQWVCIYVKAGIYREKVRIPADKPYIMLKGEGKKRSQIVWDDHFTIAQSPTFTSLADNIIVKRIRFVNSYNLPKKSNPIVRAVAAMIMGDKTSFYRCGFAGFQDTLWDQQGRHYFRKCTIQGAVDFIFGDGQSIYEECAIQVVGNGYITAQGREDPNEESGFVFKRCNIFGFGSAYLGRPWRPYSRVLFYGSNISDVVRPQGWDAWHFVGNENKLTFAEYGNYGAGASLANRVRWEKKLSPWKLKQLISMSFINTDNWIGEQPF
ncbi:probable pectinesterase 29 [Euphorbia lathyris]|uniref:probable pectinesterase 29 n=1 Tax=Euphorbia lathyris TaxID=212925 RepID=UPI003313264F